ncbi:hypothetical protein MTR67_009783 [Solanum verrucosum]|uniref:Uncharacterized protein n=1 Tax=Solanum verrucosum TaxID=315347 RepID=A0AAF0Q4S6_SOLVR|nr:hypothetical protein MTR67_009783 [Solanum verrucosum]
MLFPLVLLSPISSHRPAISAGASSQQTHTRKPNGRRSDTVTAVPLPPPYLSPPVAIEDRKNADPRLYLSPNSMCTPTKDEKPWLYVESVLMDLLDDIFAGGASKTVKAGGKFQPKAKPRPLKKGPAVASSSLTSKPTGDTVATDSSSALKSGKNSQNC